MHFSLRGSFAKATIGLMVVNPAHAAAQADRPEGAGLEDIVVSAERRSGLLQDTPVTLTALTADMLDGRQVTNVLDLATQVPNLAIDPVTGIGNAARIFLRGVGEDQAQFTADPAIGVYVDGVYLARTFGALFDFLDVERVEVLRGPQGTLFGRNTPGGAILVSSRLPSKTPTGTFDVAYGRFNELLLRGALGGPVVQDVLAASVSAVYRKRDGTSAAPNIGRDVNTKDITSARGQILFTPSSSLTLRLIGDRTWDDSDAFVPTDNFSGPPANLFVTGAAEDPSARFRTGGVSLSGSLELGVVTVGSITAYRHLTQSATLDNDGEVRRLSGQALKARQNQFSQEVTASLSTGRLEAIVGYLYFQEFNAYETVTFIGSRLNPLVRIARPDFSEQETRSHAVFGQATYAITPAIGFTVGGRYTWDEKDFLNENPTVPAIYRARRKWRNFSPRIGLDWRVNDQLFLFGSYAQGYKAGGFNRSINRVVAETPYDPELVDSIEFGLKADLAERRLRANLSFFNNDYTDLQLSSFDPGTGTTRRFNAASARTRGIELEMNARPVPGLDLYGSVGYLDARYNRFVDLVGGVLTDVSSRKLKGAPELQWNAGVGWEPDLGLPGTIRLGSDISFRDKVFNNVANTEAIATPARTLWNASLRYTAPGDRWSFTAAGRNLSNSKYPATGIFIGGLLSALYPAEPLTWSLSARYRF